MDICGSISDVRVSKVPQYCTEFRIKRIGKYYTAEQARGEIPNSFLFKTRRAAKKFFNVQALIVRSKKQALCLFGPQMDPLSIVVHRQKQS